MAMQWTEAQAACIETRDRNILVSAAAGSGKTTVLIERIKQLVLQDHVDLEAFLITTFTNAAASEMKERLEHSIREELQRQKGASYGAPSPDAAFLRRQIQMLPRASITTFHTFALGLMKEYFHLTDLQPGFTIGDDTRTSILEVEALEETFEHRFDTDAESFGIFLANYSRDRSDARLKENLRGIYKEIRSIPHYMNWLRESAEKLRCQDPLQALGIDVFLCQETCSCLEEAIRWYAQAASLLHVPQTESLYLKARQDVQQLQEILEQARACFLPGAAGSEAAVDPAAFAQVQMRLENLTFQQMRAAKAEKAYFSQVQEQVRFLRAQGKKRLDTLKRKYFVMPVADSKAILQGRYEDTRYYISLLEELESRYSQKKREQGIVDFDDVMHYAIDILEDPDVSAEVRDRYRYIFIDEYQDSNLLQEKIVSRICREDNLFMVGDVKQSIYKFRLAEPEIFRNRYMRYRQGKDPASIKIDLNNNFRSRKTIRDAVNRIFAQIMEGYDEDAALHGDAQAADPGYPVQLHIIDRKQKPGTDGGEEGDNPQKLLGDQAQDEDALEEFTEAALTARLIRDYLGKPYTTKSGETSCIRYGDIAVLSRGRKAISQIERYLNNEGIPAYGETAGGYYETVEIQVFLNLLRVISNRHRDVPLISVMSSCIFDFSPEELAKIRITCREGSFHQAVTAYEADGEDRTLAQKITAMFHQIALWKEMERTLPLDELVRVLLYDTGYYEYCSGLPVGQQRISNLRLLLMKAAAFEENSHAGLYGFLSYVEAMKHANQQEGEASILSGGENVVRVMTVHKSKGLEFPVVILVGAGKEITGGSSGRMPVLHKSMTLGLPEVNRKLHWERRTLLQRAIIGKKDRETWEEEVRILYVALTRPMNLLAIIGSTKDAASLRDVPGKGSFLAMFYPVLRQMGEEDPAAVQVQVHDGLIPEQIPQNMDPAALPLTQQSSAPEALQAQKPEDAAMAAELARRLAFVYPHRIPAGKSKYSVSELNRSADGHTQISETEIPKLASFDGAQEKLTAAQIGTALHAVMERIDFRQALEGGEEYIASFLQRLSRQGILSEQELGAVEPAVIAGFFHTDVGRRAASAEKLYREREFILSRRVDGAPAIVQGIIDCYFEEADGLVLVDYKNSWALDSEGEEAIVRRYEGQIRLYRQALEEATGQPVKEAWLYLFRRRKFLAVD